MELGRGTLEEMVDRSFWQGRRVVVTGHTGFKGGWLALWLQSMGTSVSGYALPPASGVNLFEVAGVGDGMHSSFGDIRDLNRLSASLRAAQPEIIFHLAAQALVGEGYRSPVDTYATNVMGTTHILEAAREIESLRSIVVVTSDKCYDNREWPWAYRENEPLGGADPYSSSKACAEIVTAAYRQSFFGQPDSARIASARAGNVIGGGDWSENRLIPDMLRAFSDNRTAAIRNPSSIRPWQHVLEALAGYLLLAERLYHGDLPIDALNFGPRDDDCVAVEAVANMLASCWSDDADWQKTGHNMPHEAGVLRLDSSLARQRLGWRPRWTLQQALRATVDWHRAWLEGANMRDTTLEQIKNYLKSP